ncbi:hypothetical protein PPMP20_07570 [Paraburkholderia phymatum]|uniref:Uncharacterized protein n=1 Tax=Paraburkholderia phymatum (strain DSM 17167 / CIP 108236 / LMG 21445 / STM815) TaxID=391038 RepID=B2JHW0_PARP8|nr:hypothetical protein [Paraburkholderia phymatum]ACC70452.1 conserved hypothetical protein [Paraburkholderia phymatum STM815]
MNKPSERIVVFVTPAQKRAISSTAGNLGISVSELMRRAVLSFGATSEQVKAASIVDRLRAPREPDALNEALQRVARAGKHLRQAPPTALKTPASRDASAPTHNDTGFAGSDTPREALAPIDLARPSSVAALCALNSNDHGAAGQAATQAATEAAARVAAAKAAALSSTGETDSPDAAFDTPTPCRTSTLLAPNGNAAGKRHHEQEGDESGIDPSRGSGRFA